MSTRLMSRRVSPAWLLDLHRHLGGLAVVFTAIHVAGLVADSYVTFGWAEILVPFASSWKPVAVAFGVVSLYLLVAIEVTSLAMRRLPRSMWRWIHRSSYLLFAFATYHGIAAGTDAGNPLFRVVSWAAIVVVTALTIVLVVSARRSQTRLRTLPASMSELDGSRAVIAEVSPVAIDRVAVAPPPLPVPAPPVPTPTPAPTPTMLPPSPPPPRSQPHPLPQPLPLPQPRPGRLSPIASIAPIAPIEVFVPAPSATPPPPPPPPPPPRPRTTRPVADEPPLPVPVPEATAELVRAGGAVGDAGEPRTTGT
jgi:DMSO/TMAO reductase YedYZ heme-binding membrane subunit